MEYNVFPGGFPGVSVVKKLPAIAGDTRNPGSIPGLGRSPGEGNENTVQYSCLENHMDRRAWQTTVHRAAKSQTRLSTCVRARIHTHTHTHTVSLQRRITFCCTAKSIRYMCIYSTCFFGFSSHLVQHKALSRSSLCYTVSSH